MRGLFWLSLWACACVDGASGPSDRTGEYQVLIDLAGPGGRQLEFKAELEVSFVEGVEVLDGINLRAVLGEGDLSEVLATLHNLEIGEEAEFRADFGRVSVPAGWSADSGPVELDLLLDGAFVQGGLCGLIEGRLITGNEPLAGGTFGGVRWQTRSEDSTSSCARLRDEIPRTDHCFGMVNGVNTDFPSAGELRTFRLEVSEAYTGSTPLPVVFAWHDFDEASADLVDFEFRLAAQEARVLLIAPDALERDGRVGFDTKNPPVTNKDLVFFDDLLTCVGNTYSLDLEHVTTLGVGSGGLMSGYLLAHRADTISAAAVLSGGLTTPYAPTAVPPAMIWWGGAADEADDQDYDRLSELLVSTFTGEQRGLVECEHDQGHIFEPTWWVWIFDYLEDHPKGVRPWQTLPAAYAPFCQVVQAPRDRPPG